MIKGKWTFLKSQFPKPFRVDFTDSLAIYGTDDQKEKYLYKLSSNQKQLITTDPNGVVRRFEISLLTDSTLVLIDERNYEIKLKK
jgi:hypothetical protein